MFRHLPALLLALLLVATVVSVPATAANREHQQMMADIRMLQEQTQQLQVAITTLADSVKAINGRLDEQAGVARKQFADQKLLVDGIAADLRVVREKIDDNNVRVGSLAQDLDAVRQIVAQIPIVPAAPSDAAAPAAAVPVPSAAAALGQSPERAFNSAWSDYASAQYSLAIQGFEAYIRTFPKSDAAAEAQFYIGESQFLQGKYQEAVAAYDRVIADYPASRRVADAYFKKGRALVALGQPDRAREAWEFVVKTFPNSDAGRLARQQLDQPIKK